MRQTTIIKTEAVQKQWLLIDAESQIVGKVATLAAHHLRGKAKPTFTPHVDMGDNIVIINAAKVIFAANKETTKKYYSHSGYPGGLKVVNAKTLRQRKPIAILERAIRGMLPHTKLGRKQFRNLYVYPDANHKHEAQKPQKIEVI